MKLNDVCVVKKDGTLEPFDVQKIIVAVNKSAFRALVTFTEEDHRFICKFVEEKVIAMGKTRYPGKCSRSDRPCKNDKRAVSG